MMNCMVPFDLLIKLMEKSIDLLQERRDSRRRLFDVFVKPVDEEFESVHKEYLASLANYRDEIRKGGEWVEQLIDLIERDRLFTYGHRTKLVMMYESIDDVAFQEFITAIDRYSRSATGVIESCSISPRLISILLRGHLMNETRLTTSM